MEHLIRTSPGLHLAPPEWPSKSLSAGRSLDGDSSPSLQGLSRFMSNDSPSSTAAPLTYLEAFLTSNRHSCSVYELIQWYAKCWKCLPEATKSGRGSEYDDLVATTSGLVKSSYTSLLDLLPVNDNTPAIVDGASRTVVQQGRLSKFVRGFSLPGTGSGTTKDIVAVALPNGPLLGLLSIAVVARYTLAPINVTSGSEQFRIDLLTTGSKNVLVLQADIPRLGLDQDWVAEHGIEVHVVSPAQDMTCTISSSRERTLTSAVHTTLNGPDDTCLMLFTSGTTGTKKIVPITLHSIICGVAFVGDSWGLTGQDVCLNMMPLNHVGGLVRNLFAPILLGGSTICCSAFDPTLFWDLVMEQSPTWYYASPSMHSLILDEAPSPSAVAGESHIRMVCNAAGGLLPSLAIRLRDTFHCTVLPSYGMTECMPITTPPLDYALERPGTSGISTGPELAILDGTGQREHAGRIGRICVRGGPLFPGYLVDGKIDKSTFTDDGWFNTGDLGYLDSDGYLYITGRSKEVINRGGEIISPFEIEEAIINAARKEGSPIHGRVADSLAFSVAHDTLQETVGIVLVTPPGKPRVDLRQLQEAIRLSLHSTKWPVVIVYMNAVPKRSGKLCRVQLGERLDFEPLRDDVGVIERHFEASCPAPDTPITTKIKKSPCNIDRERTIDTIDGWCNGQADVLAKVNTVTGFLDVILAPRSTLSRTNRLDIDQLRLDLRRTLPGYLIPGKITLHDTPFPRDLFGSIDPTCLDSVSVKSGARSTDSPLEVRIREIFSNLLAVAIEDIPSDSDFFELGGDSLKAGRLLSILRKEFNARIPIDQLFTFSKVSDICNIINDILLARKETSERTDTSTPACIESCSSTRIPLLFIHLLPLAVFTPLKKALFWIAFLKAWGVILIYLYPEDTKVNLIYLLLAMLMARSAMSLLMPMLSLVAKWTIIGRYREGLYPMWSTYHTRWWIVQKILHICGMGVFKHFNWSRILFYQLCGAKIGKGVTIQPGTILGEYDLLDIGDNVELDRCVCRPFAVEQNTAMYLGKIRLGKNSAAGLKTIIAPGTDLPADICLGTNSSSWEWRTADGSNYNQMASKIPQPHVLLWVLLGLPILLVVKFISLIPWIAGLSGLSLNHHPPEGADLMIFLLQWYANPARVGFHFLARILGVVFSPMLYLSLAIAIKHIMDAMFGKMLPSMADQRSHVDRFRMALMSRFIPNGNISEVTGFFGTHYDITSMIVRKLGGKVGERVYWPGNGPSIQNFDLIDIGNDVVFGSRSHLVTSDGIGSDFVRIADSAMIADRVVILPGSQVGKQTVLGSGTLTRRNDNFSPHSTWIGANADGPKCLNTPSPSRSTSSNFPQQPRLPSFYSVDGTMDGDEKGISWSPTTDSYSASFDSRRSSVELSSLLANSSSQTRRKATTPFGRAFYEKNASFRVYGLPVIIIYSVLMNIFVSVYWNVPTVLTLQLLYKLANNSFLSEIYTASAYRPLLILSTLFLSFSFFHVIFSTFALAICICAKWVLVGRREQGDYDWDKSSYCQRWQILLTIERLRRKNIGGEDILSMLTGTHYMSLYFRLLGATIGRHCALFASGEITLSFTEPDLLTLGDRVAVDDASLVAHINSRGNFKMNPLVVGDRCVLRTGSRLLSGATMGNDACLLEHTLVMAGDEIDDGTTAQGWPADNFEEARFEIEETEEGKETVQESDGNAGFGRSRWFFGPKFGGWFWRNGYSGRYERIG